jgi:hypothetical protein
MRVKFEATDATGKMHKRSSMSHVYSHCVVIHFAAHLPSKLWPKGVAAYSHAEWVESCALAERKASRWRKDPCVEAIEILEAKQVAAVGNRAAPHQGTRTRALRVPRGGQVKPADRRHFSQLLSGCFVCISAVISCSITRPSFISSMIFGRCSTHLASSLANRNARRRWVLSRCAWS